MVLYRGGSSSIRPPLTSNLPIYEGVEVGSKRKVEGGQRRNRFFSSENNRDGGGRGSGEVMVGGEGCW